MINEIYKCVLASKGSWISTFLQLSDELVALGVPLPEQALLARQQAHAGHDVANADGEASVRQEVGRHSRHAVHSVGGVVLQGRDSR